MAQLTYWEDAELEQPHGWEPAPDDVHTLRHGYNLADIDRLARASLWRAWGLHLDYSERYDLAWSGIVEHLYAAGEPPTPSEMIGAGQDAIGVHVRDEARHHGQDHHNEYEQYRRFDTYWRWVSRYTPSPEHRVVDRTALWQIWPELTTMQRRSLLALAASGTYQAAAESLGIRQKTVQHHIYAARRRFLQLWHGQEKPSRIWGADRRVHRAGAAQSATSYRKAAAAVRRRDPQRAAKAIDARRTEPVHGKVGTYNRRKCRCGPCIAAKSAESTSRRRKSGAAVRRFMTVSQLKDAVRRHEAGETWSAIAADFGFSDGYLRSLRRGAAQPVPDQLGEVS